MENKTPNTDSSIQNTRKQCVVRTYPMGWTNTTEHLEQKLADGYIVVMANPFDTKGKQGMEYILEKKN